MSKSLSVWMYLKRQKATAEGKIPIYVRVIIDGDEDDFSLSRKVSLNEWNQQKQKSTGKSQEAILINAKITKIKGELTRIFDRFSPNEVVRAREIINIFQGEEHTTDANATIQVNKGDHETPAYDISNTLLKEFNEKEDKKRH